MASSQCLQINEKNPTTCGQTSYLRKFLTGQSDKPKTDKVFSSSSAQDGLDLERLYAAVAQAESGNCSTKWHKAANNCVSIMSWAGGKCHLKHFSSIEASKAEFKRIWTTSYKVFPTLKEAIKYTGNDRAAGWLSIVKKYY